jgi:hypothetical protein
VIKVVKISLERSMKEPIMLSPCHNDTYFMSSIAPLDSIEVFRKTCDYFVLYFTVIEAIYDVPKALCIFYLIASSDLSSNSSMHFVCTFVFHAFFILRVSCIVV